MSCALVITHIPMPRLSSGNTSCSDVLISFSDISRDDTGWECQSPIYSTWLIVRFDKLFL